MLPSMNNSEGANIIRIQSEYYNYLEWRVT